MGHQEDIRVGDVFALNMVPAQGINPQGYATRRKFFIVVGFDEEGNVYGGVVFNSQINPRLSEIVRTYHLPIDDEAYPFLSHRSFVNCSSLKKVMRDDMLKGKRIGEMRAFDLDLIIGALIECPLVPNRDLQRIGIKTK